MTEKFNRSITASLRFIEGGQVGDIIFDSLAQENEQRLPLEISGNVTKTIVSGLDTCGIKILNSELIKEFYQDKETLYKDFSKNDLALHVSCGYGDSTWPIFSGDFIDFNISGGNSLTDQAFVIKSASGHRAISRGEIQQRFPAGTTFREIVEACFEVLFEQFGIELTADRLVDPEGKLEKELLKPRTEDRQISEVLTDICRKHDFVWGIGHRDTAVDPQKGYFVDKRAYFPMAALCGEGPHDVNYQTGLIGLPSFQKTSFTFRHKPDKCLNIGTLIRLDVSPQINTNQKFEGRINDIGMSLSNKSGGFEYQITCQYFEDGFAVLDSHKVNDGGERL